MVLKCTINNSNNSIVHRIRKSRWFLNQFLQLPGRLLPPICFFGTIPTTCYCGLLLQIFCNSQATRHKEQHSDTLHEFHFCKTCDSERSQEWQWSTILIMSTESLRKIGISTTQRQVHITRKPTDWQNELYRQSRIYWRKSNETERIHIWDRNIPVDNIASPA